MLGPGLAGRVNSPNVLTHKWNSVQCLFQVLLGDSALKQALKEQVPEMKKKKRMTQLHEESEWF